ncbi:hypothetical protein GLDPPO_GLDPPO_06840, partial [Dysosmobacter welbionis]
DCPPDTDPPAPANRAARRPCRPAPCRCGPLPGR